MAPTLRSMTADRPRPGRRGTTAFRRAGPPGLGSMGDPRLPARPLGSVLEEPHAAADAVVVAQLGPRAVGEGTADWVERWNKEVGF